MAIASLKSIEDILDEKFVVKTYQRGYRWEKTEIEELLTDLDNFQDGRGSNVYCLQPIVVKKDGDEYELVDGQQRLTALWLLKKYHQVLFKNLGEAYTFRYEGKDSFTQLLKDIEILCNDVSKTQDDLLTLVNSHRDDSIDAYMLAESVQVIHDFQIDKTKLIQAVLAGILGKMKYIGIIWYELEKTEDAISFFTNLNANKVPLTDAELIKAALYHSNKSDDNRKAMISEWQEIEKRLYDDELWHFVTYDANKAVRIEYLFEIWCCANGLPIEPEDKNPVFHAVNNYLAMRKVSADELWNEIKAVYEALDDWKNGYKSYHIIGFLTLVNGSRDKNVKLIKELYKFYSEHKKSDFEEELKRRVKECFIGPKLLANKVDETDIRDGISDLRYEESNNIIKCVLQFYNIALLLEADNRYERFPFKALKVYNYDIEHVNPQTPEFNLTEKKIWLEDHKEYSDLSSSLIAEVDSCIMAGMVNFEVVANKIRTELGMDEHFIGNLVLLDSGLNRSYKNVCFIEKRREIIKRLRSDIQFHDDETRRKKPILPGTRWVFLKEYDGVETNKIWMKSDVETYAEDLGRKIYNYLK